MNLPIKLPDFRHPEVRIFYEYDLSIPQEKVAKILKLPRTSLIADMELMLMDSIERNSFFQNYPDENKWWAFNFHALWVLTELEAREALPTILKTLQQDEEFNWFWWGDYITEGFWEVLYLLGKNALEELQQFVLLQPGDWVTGAIASTAVAQIALHQPERKPEIIEWYRSLLDTFLNRKKHAIAPDDSELISSIVSDLISLNAKEFLPQIKRLDERELLVPMFVGDFESIQEDIQNPRFINKMALKTSIVERYEEVLSWYGPEKSEDSYAMDDLFDFYEEDALMKEPLYTPPSPNEPFKRERKKAGRNDPCPCGSGKKYKKCCWNKVRLE